jgi:hypothetical protein
VANVKGSSLASRILWVELGHGAAGIARLRKQASPELLKILDAGIQKAHWYAFEQFIELNVVMDRIFGAGDLGLIKEIARDGADANLTTIYRLFFKLGSVNWILGRAVRLWSAHYDSGYLEVLTRGPRSAVLKIRGFATPHPVHCLAVAGWAERSVELSGGKRVSLVESKCRNRGDELCQMDVRWEN